MAIIYYGTEISFGELASSVERLSGFLVHELAVKRRDRILLYMQNCPQYIIAYYAILRADAVVVPVNPMNRAEELRHIVQDTGARVAIVAQELLPFVAPSLDEDALTGVVVTAYGDLLAKDCDLPLPESMTNPPPCLDPRCIPWQKALAGHLMPPPHRAGADDWCLLAYSSGTTGAPKGCLHSHRGVNATLIGSVVWNPIDSQSVVLATLPLFHVTGMQNSMNGPIYAGATIILMTRWDRRLAAEFIERYRVTHWRSITTMAVDFISDPDIGSRDLSSLRAVGGGGAQMPEAVAAKFQDLLGLGYIEGYGLTETVAATHINPPNRPKRQCLGIPVFDVDARIIDP
ncbi:MAG TPA: AMP-binding protein, partial [Kiloniellaceae bacterium]|nr:AMP-binding protein [Kiloniellaceae bacterium]